MAETYGFFDAIDTGGGNYDRSYSQTHWAALIALLMKDGVIKSQGNGLQASLSATTNSVDINTGSAMCRGFWYKNGTITTFTVPAASTQYARIDSIVLKLDSQSARSMVLAYKQGTPALAPVAAALLDTTAVKELRICKILVPANNVAITADKITDTRNTTECGYASAIYDTLLLEMLEGKSDASHTHEYADSISSSGVNAVKSSAIYTALADKLSKLAGMTAGNLPIINADGTLSDSGKAPGNFATQNKQRTVTLTVEGWSNKVQTVAVDGVTPSNTVMVGASLASNVAYREAQVLCTAQAAGQLTFTCVTEPIEALSVNVVIL